jgi:hypothetical protein
MATNKKVVNSQKKQLSLSDYYPDNTVYFYQFPSGKKSGFFNPSCAPWQELLGSARPLTCAGERIKVVTFSQSAEPKTRYILEELMHTRLLPTEKMVVLPKKIDNKTLGQARDNLIIDSLKSLLKKKSLIMAQPYIDKEMEEFYQFPSMITARLNDKHSWLDYTPKKHSPKLYRIFANGQHFFSENFTPPLPCVVKISSSCGGDGVRICKEISSYNKAKIDFQGADNSIIVEQFIVEKINIGIQFGIPHNPKKEIDIIGFNQQYIDDDGNYLGGIIDPKRKISVLPKIYKILREDVLPKVRQTGWYGVGGIDVLIDHKDEFYFIDPNFRMTAVFPYVCLAHNGEITKPMISLMGTCEKSYDEFLDKIVPLAKPGNQQILTMINLIKELKGFRFNCGLLFDSKENLFANAERLISLGVKSEVLRRIVLGFKSGKLSELV